jgi:LysW-gamma-L-lysine/LysW-L-ornithine aminotransferase
MKKAVTMTELNYAQIEETILGGTTQRRGETVMVRGEGSWLFDSAGKRYLDLTAAQGVAMLGHCHPKLSAALAAQAHQLIALPNFLYNDTRARFAEALVNILPAHLNHVFLANSGAEAVDGAIKFARLTTGRTGLVATMRGFHGRTIGAVSVTWEPKYRKPFEPLLATTHVPYNNLGKLDAAVTDETAMVILEVVQGEGGVNMGDGDYLRGAQQLCHDRGALLVLDEIQTGFGRTGQWFGHQHFGLQPDIICLAKGIGGGFPMGALAYTDQVNASLSPGAHGSTFGGSPIACAAGLASLQIYQEEGLIERSAQMGEHFLNRLRATIGDYEMVRDIRGLGMMIAIELREKVGPYLKILMEEQGVIALPAGTNVLRLLPPLTLTNEELEIGVAAIAAVLPNE